MTLKQRAEPPVDCPEQPSERVERLPAAPHVPGESSSPPEPPLMIPKHIMERVERDLLKEMVRRAFSKNARVRATVFDNPNNRAILCPAPRHAGAVPKDDATRKQMIGEFLAKKKSTS